MSKVKVSVAQKTMKDPELIDMFNKMVGASDPDPSIVIPKYDKIMQNAEEIIRILESFVKSPAAKAFQYDFKKGFQEIYEFVNKSKEELGPLTLEKNDNVLTGTDLNSLNSDPQKMAEFLQNTEFKYKVAKLGETYTSLKNSSVIKEMIMTARNLKNALMLEKTRTGSKTHDLEDKDHLQKGFIVKADGDFLILFNFTSLDFKQMYFCDYMTAQYSQYILFVLHLIYKKVLNIVKEITSPDIDVDKFSELLVRNIDDIRKHIPRCDKAFDKIKASVGLLKGNFGEYYKDFISSQNPGIIVEHFVSDVAQSSKTDVETTRQFRKIIEFYQKNMQSRITDPKVKKIFKLVGANLDILEEKTTKRTERRRTQKTEEETPSSLDDMPNEEQRE